jgi:hypothetical protein
MWVSSAFDRIGCEEERIESLERIGSETYERVGRTDEESEVSLPQK